MPLRSYSITCSGNVLLPALSLKQPIGSNLCVQMGTEKDWQDYQYNQVNRFT